MNLYSNLVILIAAREIIPNWVLAEEHVVRVEKKRNSSQAFCTVKANHHECGPNLSTGLASGFFRVTETRVTGKPSSDFLCTILCEPGSEEKM